MTLACKATLGLSLLLYLIAALLFHGALLFRRPAYPRWGYRVLVTGLGVHAAAMTAHFLFSGRSPLSSMLVMISVLTLGMLAAALLGEHRLGTRRISLVASPLAFLALLYALLMPLRFDQAESLLLRHPWLGVHVGLTLIGYLCFAVAFCGAVAYLAQHRALKQGRLSPYLPSLEAAAMTTLRFSAVGFWSFSVGLIMGVIWFFDPPGESLRPQDAKIWMALPTWGIFAVYLYRRAIAGVHGRRLKWWVVAGFLLALANLLAVRHSFEAPGSAETPASVPAARPHARP